jgi:hypothetical protein
MNPVEVVATILRQLSLYCPMDRISVADNQATSQQEARVVLKMQSVFHKWNALVKVKSFLAKH